MKRKFVITFLFSVIVFSLGYIFLLQYLNVLEASSNGKKENIKGIDLGENNRIEKIVDHEILFLLTGVDENEEGSEQMNSRTDTLMLVKVNTATGKIQIISIPRDSRVLIRGEFDKINHAHAYGGMTLTLRTIRDWLGIDLDYYVKLNYQAVIEMVDAMGGVELDVPFDIELPEMWIHLKQGRHKLSGWEALFLARYREGYEDGDLGRVHAQQNIMKEIIKQALSIDKIGHVGDYLKTYAKHVDTNVPYSTILELIPAMSKLNTENVETYTIPGDGRYIDDVSYFIYDQLGTEQLVDKVLEKYKLFGN